MAFFSGFMGIVGPPNAGKSTLMNRIIGSKLSIVSPKPQTTRNRIIGIWNGSDFQIVFFDTPGIHKTKTYLHNSMVSSATAIFNEVDIILVVLDVNKVSKEETQFVLNQLKGIPKPIVAVLNKIDKINYKDLLPIISGLRSEADFKSIIPISARNGDGVDILTSELKTMLSPGEAFFPSDMKSDYSEDFFVAEIIREKLFYNLRGEIPYSSAVTVESMEENEAGSLLNINAKIHVETESQKIIVVGRGGRVISKIGTEARQELERYFGIKIYLSLFVRVEKNWTKDPQAMRRLGY